jgi:hypothetical protein
MLFESFLFLYQLIPNPREFMLLQFDGKMVLDTKIDLMISDPIYKVYFIFISEQKEDLV